MATETATSTQTTQIDPTIQPYLTYGLTEAQRLYQGGGPQYYAGQTYVSPSATTQQAIQALQQRATTGSPLLSQAQQQTLGTIKGDYLGGNPFFQGAFQPAAQAARQAFETALGDIGSKASLAGRYGSGAMGNLQQQASGQFAQKLTDTAGQLAYQNYAQERARQQQATAMAPEMAQADYGDIQRLLAAGQLGEGYQGQALQADINRFNYQQQLPQQQLNQYLNQVYGFPAGRTTTTQTPYYTNPLATGLGTGLLGVNLLTGLNRLTGGGVSNWLGGFSTPSGWGTSGLENAAGVNFLTGDNYR
jgi:hypothetical protein